MSAAAMMRELDDITECPVCMSSFDDPRVLPCIHTYCCKCIKTWCKDKLDGDKISCPQCRKEFVIPDGGVEELPKNFFLTKLLGIKDLSAGSHEIQLCDVCLSAENVSTDKTAKMFCLDCQQKQCSTCHLSHSMFKQFQSHKTVSIHDKIKEEELWSKFPPPYCEKHGDKYLEIYCFDCKTISCIMCYIEQHNSHKCSDVNKVSEEFRAELTQRVESLNRCIEKGRTTAQSLENNKTLFSNRIDEIETEVCKKAQQLHDVIERHKQMLLNELDEIKKNRMKEIDNVHSEIEQHTSLVASLQIYMKQMNQKGSACDVVREANSLKSRFSELLNEATTVEKSMESLGSVDVSFAPEASKWKDDFNAIGKITAQRADPLVSSITSDLDTGTLTLGHSEGVHLVDTKASSTKSEIIEMIRLKARYRYSVCKYRRKKSRARASMAASKQSDDQHGTPTLVRVLPCDSVNAGVGSLELYDNKLFVGREGGAQVEVYDARTWSLIRRLSIAGLGNSVYGLAACDYNKCLYVSDRYKSCVHKVDLSTYDVMLKWSVADCPWGLSVNGAHNVLVACYKADRIQEYSSVGSLVRNICIAGNSPFHGIQISYDRIVVSHSGTSHTVCMVGVDGQVIKRYGQQQGSAVRQLNYPECIAVDKQGCILVADYCNSRIMVLNQLLTDTRQLSLTADGGLRRPVSIHFDESRDRLYVGEGGGLCRVLVFDDVCHMSALFNN